MPARYSWTLAERTPSWSCAASDRSWTTALKRLDRTISAGYGASAQSVSHGSTASIARSAPANAKAVPARLRSEEHTSELQSHHDLVCRLLLEKKKRQKKKNHG